MNLKNAVALITGGSSGIGRAIGQALVASGARVAITGRDERRLTEAARSLANGAPDILTESSSQIVEQSRNRIAFGI